MSAALTRRPAPLRCQSNNLFPGGFRGQRILAATLRSMVKFLEFGATQSTRLLFGGCTPGAVYNLDVVANTIRGLGIKEGA